MVLNLDQLRKAADSLDRAIAQPENEFTRDAVIKRFEFCYELAWKAVRSTILTETSLDPVELASRRELFRVAAQHGLIPDPELWFKYHEMRNLTSHTYHEATALQVYAAAKEFAQDFRTLIVQLESRRA